MKPGHRSEKTSDFSTRVVRPETWSLPTLETASGCFETMRAYQGRLFRLDGHLERLFASMRYLGVRLDGSPQALRQQLLKALADARLKEAVVRVALIPDAKRVARPSIVVAPAIVPAAALYRRGLRVAVVPTRKFPVSQIDPQSKFSARQGSVMALLDAQLRDVDEALFLDGPGFVTESTASNFGIIERGRFVAAPCWLGLLAGITWMALEEVARSLKIPIEERPLTRHEIYNADEAFMSSTLKEIIAVTTIDGRRIGSGKPGPVVARLHRGFQALARRELRLK